MVDGLSKTFPYLDPSRKIKALQMFIFLSSMCIKLSMQHFLVDLLSLGFREAPRRTGVGVLQMGGQCCRVDKRCSREAEHAWRG